MCDYSLHATASRPAVAGDKLITTSFARTSTRGLAAETDQNVAVCLRPGTELGFVDDVKFRKGWLWPMRAGYSVARFCKIEPSSHEHQDALEFPNGKIVLVVNLMQGQRAKVLQVPPNLRDNLQHTRSPRVASEQAA